MPLDLLRSPPPTSQIAQERVEPGPASARFMAATAGLSLLAALLGIYLGGHPTSPVAAEVSSQTTPGSLLIPLGWHAARATAAVFAGLAVAATCVAARRLFHSAPVALLAGTLVALDPALLASARLAIPDSIAIAALMASFGFFLAVPFRAHWLGAGALLLAGLVEPRSLLWAIPCAWLLLLRGHIYAAPRHLGMAAVQTLGAALVGAGLHLATTGGDLLGLPCKAHSYVAGLGILEVPDYGAGLAAVPNPVTWFGGLGALLLTGGAALWTVVRQFRMARLPGKIQMRLALPLEPQHARTLWLLFIALVVPSPVVWLPIFAIALAAAIGAMSEDAPGFGVAVGFVLILVAVAGLWRAWPLLTGSGDVTRLVPWATAIGC